MEKKGDPEEFTIPCIIGHYDDLCSLCDNGASIFDTSYLYTSSMGNPHYSWETFFATGRTLMNSENHDIMFQVKDEKITFKARKGHLFPIDVGNISVVETAEDKKGKAGHKFKESPKKKKAKNK
ncbi:hypothetical protein HAX54_017312 [Datura stramonium]|uniref:Uncharacterized protein n=1 Tax=Datura stramonium TaxID=4076 RepID=A0ABS8UKG7_DATST|nr:hypothetical protein [Datura stramonium]